MSEITQPTQEQKRHMKRYVDPAIPLKDQDPEGNPFACWGLPPSQPSQAGEKNPDTTIKREPSPCVDHSQQTPLSRERRCAS